MKKHKLKKELKKHKEIIESYQYLLEEYSETNKRLKKSLKRFEQLLDELEVEEELTEEEIDQLLSSFESELNDADHEDVTEN